MTGQPDRPSHGTSPDSGAPNRPITAATGEKGQPRRSARLPRKAIDRIVETRRDTLIAECGCLIYPAVLANLISANKKSAYCESHGWQHVRPATIGEAMPDIKLAPVLLPDEPPF